LVEAGRVQDVARLVSWSAAHDVPVLVLGGGSNLLVSDRGFPGLVISTRALRGVHVEGETVTAACGEPLSALARRADRSGLTGLEWAAGIPGTVGGAVVMNAGTREGDIASVLSEVRIQVARGLDVFPVHALALGYRTSALRTGQLRGVVLEATFRLGVDDPERCVQREYDLLTYRRARQPAGASAGCIFKNPPGAPPAGVLLDTAGCKGLRVGAAWVSQIHANFLLNGGTQNAAEILQLIECMQARVREVHGILLEPEVEIIDQRPRRAEVVRGETETLPDA
jgi:UDP-N-acetylmuramate dehydrogenase